MKNNKVINLFLVFGIILSFTSYYQSSKKIQQYKKYEEKSISIIRKNKKLEEKIQDRKDTIDGYKQNKKNYQRMLKNHEV